MLTVLYTQKVQRNEPLLLLAAERHLDQMLHFLLHASAAASGSKRWNSWVARG